MTDAGEGVWSFPFPAGEGLGERNSQTETRPSSKCLRNVPEYGRENPIFTKGHPMIVLSNVKKLYDGTAGTTAAVHEGVDVWVDGGTIEAVKPHEAHPSHGRDVCRVDCSSLTVTPGLIDCHSHVTVLGVRDEDLAAMNGPAGMLYTERIFIRDVGPRRRHNGA